MHIVFKTDQGNIRLSGTFLVTTAIATFLFLTAMISAADYYSSSVVMNGTVSNIVTVNISPALTRGVLFGDVTADTDDNMAENDTTGTGNTSEYWVGSDPATTGTLDIWNYAPDMDRSGVTQDVIVIENVTHEANTTWDGENVNMTLTTDGDEQLTNLWAKLGGTGDDPCNDLAIGSACWVAYWLDVPANIPGGTYNTSYYYCGNLSFSSVSCDG